MRGWHWLFLCQRVYLDLDAQSLTLCALWVAVVSMWHSFQFPPPVAVASTFLYFCHHNWLLRAGELPQQNWLSHRSGGQQPYLLLSMAPCLWLYLGLLKTSICMSVCLCGLCMCLSVCRVHVLCKSSILSYPLSNVSEPRTITFWGLSMWNYLQWIFKPIRNFSNLINQRAHFCFEILQ